MGGLAQPGVVVAVAVAVAVAPVAGHAPISARKQKPLKPISLLPGSRYATRCRGQVFIPQ
jgi:hypothetical protein